MENKEKINFQLNQEKKDKISFLKESNKNDKKQKSNTHRVATINHINKNAIVTTSVSDSHYAVLLKGSQLLSINQIFAILQSHKYELFLYKKTWHQIIEKILNQDFINMKKEGRKMPFFDSEVSITIFRQAPRLVDQDALTTMFKFIIDAFKYNKENNPYGILAEDNPKIVHKIESYSEKGEYFVGIKIEKIKLEKFCFLPDNILKKS